MKFTMAVKKHNKVSIGRSEGHNVRQHPTASQLHHTAWIPRQGRHPINPWREDRLDAARAMAKRKDAVVALEIIVQVGNQTDWRYPPTQEHPCGQPRKGKDVPNLNTLVRSVREAMVAEFGASNVVSIELHTDESSPHVHAIVTPIHEGKLQAKHWLNGPVMLAAMRKRIHATVRRAVACTYTPGAPGGDPYDPRKAAGRSGGPQVAPGILRHLSDVLSASTALAEARRRILELEKQVQSLFSRLKAAERVATDRLADMDAAHRRAGEADKKLRDAQAEILRLRVEVERLKPKPEPGPTTKPEPGAKPHGYSASRKRDAPTPGA